MVHQVVDIINEKLQGICVGQKLFGIAQSMIRVQGTERNLLPCIINEEGEGEWVGIDDIHALTTYHKMNSFTSNRLTNGKGDNVGDIVNTYTMALLVTWFKKRIKLSPDEVVRLVQTRMPDIIGGQPDIKMCRLRVTNGNLNTLQVFSQEYSTEANIPSTINIAQINYTIELTFNPVCTIACP